MRKLFFITALALACLSPVGAQQPQKKGVQTSANKDNAKGAEIKFETLTHDFGTFDEKDCPVTFDFAFTNVGTEPLLIHQAITTCGCTVPTYPKEPIAPGASGKITVVYNGRGKFPGKFHKNVTVRTNSKSTSVTRLFIDGVMTADK